MYKKGTTNKILFKKNLVVNAHNWLQKKVILTNSYYWVGLHYCNIHVFDCSLAECTRLIPGVVCTKWIFQESSTK